MTWRSTTLQMVGMAVLLLFAVGCKPKPPATPEDLSATRTDVTPPKPQEVTRPADPVAVDRTPDPLAGDLRDANDYAYKNGLLGEVYFDFDKYELTAAARDRLARNASFLKDNPTFSVTVEGHCDERGTNEYNIALGANRANAAVDYLVSLGVAAKRMRTISYGEERPNCRDSSESCWAKNRRAYFLLSGRS